MCQGTTIVGKFYRYSVSTGRYGVTGSKSVYQYEKERLHVSLRKGNKDRGGELVVVVEIDTDGRG